MHDDEPDIEIRPLRPCRIILVHGTWPAGMWKRPRRLQVHGADRIGRSLWYESKSYFRIRLDSEFLETDTAHMYYPFMWSGSNSVLARDKAAQSLAQLLKQGFKYFQKDKFVVI